MTLYATISWSAHGSDIAIARRQTQLVELIVSKMQINVAHEQESATVWDDAVEAVRNGGDEEWLDTNLGRWMNTYFGHDGAFVLSPDGKLIYGFLSNQTDPVSAHKLVEPVAFPLVLKLQARLAAGDSYGVTDRVLSIGESKLAAVGGRPAIISVKPIISDTGDIKQDPGTEALHVAVRYLDSDFLETVAKEYLFNQLRFSWSATNGDGRLYAPLTTASGQFHGYFSWIPFQPGAGLVKTTTPVLCAAALVLLAVISGLAQLIARRSSRLKETQVHLTHMAHHDALTGLPNRSSFNACLEDVLGKADTAKNTAVLYMDLDRFKQVNDTLGHPIGDKLLIAVAGRLLETCGPDTPVTRLGGDEFTIIVQDTAIEEVERLSSKLIAAVRRPFEIDGQPILIGLSIGVASVQGSKATGSELTRMADIALYHAKSAGRNRYAIFGAHMDEMMQSKRELEADLRLAVGNSELSVHYQPIYAAKDGRMTGVEALLRWKHLQKGSISPDVFIPLAEDLGLIERLGVFVLEEACTAALAWKHLEVAVNASAVELRSDVYALRVLPTLNRIGFDPQRLEIEITESALLDDSGCCERNIEHLRSAGVRFALDDFGTGFSSFGRLQRLNVDRIKIDRCFVSGFGHASGSEAIVKAMIGLAQAKGLQTTAEGIETIEQSDELRRLGCDQLQGYLMSIPVSLERLTQLIAEVGLAQIKKARVTNC
ncbi:putative bifunctional diguanylate cyclase/phosphodiesterase [Pararhizobium sp. PWRC1-1]|uniref:putative bifunctional diguanylate cyclase/phosphodiesterase n=1 Tax=Pararhizobium sp. PWRC1-1 TaxID=2804566 RepID=UPI003CEA35C5